MITIDMLDRIVCPICKNSLRETKPTFTQYDWIIEGELVCSHCQRRYSISEGIVNTLPDELRLQKNLKEGNWGEWRKRLDLFRQRMKDWQEEDSRRTIPVYEELFHRFCSIKGSTLEIGCGNGAVRHFFDRDIEYWGIDPDKEWILHPLHLFAENIFPCLKEDFPFIQGVGEYLPFKDESFDNVIIIAVLDHTNSPFQVFEESFRVLKDKGQILLLVCVGQHQMTKGQIPSSLRKGINRLLKGELTGLAKSIFRRLFIRVEPDFSFSNDDIIHFFHRFSDLEIMPYDKTLKFFKAKKKMKHSSLYQNRASCTSNR